MDACAEKENETHVGKSEENARSQRSVRQSVAGEEVGMTKEVKKVMPKKTEKR